MVDLVEVRLLCIKFFLVIGYPFVATHTHSYLTFNNLISIGGRGGGRGRGGYMGGGGGGRGRGGGRGGGELFLESSVSFSVYCLLS